MLCQDVKEFFQISAEHHLQQYLDLTCNEKHYSIIYANISDIKVQHIQKYSDLGNCETQICNMKAVIHNQWR
jgi:hypothetical protein